MGTQKGQTNNPNGRPLGKQNKVTQKVKNTFSALLSNNLSKLQSDIDQLNSKDRIYVLLQLAEFVVPKLSREENLNLNMNLDDKDKVVIYLPDNGRG